MTKLLLTLTLCILFAAPVQAGMMDVDLYGMSFHLQGAAEANPDAPNKLDSSGVVVFNPGLGLGYDFRKDIETGGFSGIVKGGWFQDCANKPFVFAGGGLRWRQFLTEKMFYAIDGLAVVSYAEDWEEDKYQATILPVANIGLGWKFEKHLVTLSAAYVPEDNNISATSGTDLLFLNLSVSF